MSRWSAPPSPRLPRSLWAVTLACCAAQVAWGQDSADPMAQAPTNLYGRVQADLARTLAMADGGARLSVSAQTEPRGPTDGGWAGAETADAQGRTYTQTSTVTLHWWTGTGRLHFGLGAGAVGFSAPASPEQSQVLVNTAPTLSVGARYQFSRAGTVYADATGARPGALADTASDVYQTRVGLEFRSANASQMAMLRQQALSVQLSSGYRLSLRPRGGGLGVYLRGQF